MQHRWAMVTKFRLCITHHHTSYPRGSSMGSNNIVYHQCSSLRARPTYGGSTMRELGSATEQLQAHAVSIGKEKHSYGH